MADRIGTLEADFWLEDDGLARGFVIDAEDPSARLIVEILADGFPVAVVRGQEVIDVPAGSPENAVGYGFSIRIDDEVLAKVQRLVARLANSDIIIGSVAVGGVKPVLQRRREAVGRVRWAGGLRIVGHLAKSTDRLPSVKALIEGVEVARALCRSWIQLEHHRVGRAFELHLPEVFADGRVRPVAVLTDEGVELPGSPCLVVAFPDRLADWIDGWAEVESETIRARFADTLLPKSLPFTELEGWLARFPWPRPKPARLSRVAVVVVGGPGRDATLASLDHQSDVDWTGAALQSAEGRIRFEAAQLSTFLQEDAADCDLVVMAVSGASFALGALALFAESADRFPDAKGFYSDLMVEAPDGRRWPRGFPAFDAELFLETAYCGLVYAIRREAALAAAGHCTSLFDLFPFGDDETVVTTPVHLPALLATIPDLDASELLEPLREVTRSRLDAAGTAAEIAIARSPQPRSVVVSRARAPGSVAAVIAVRDNGSALDRTLASLEATRERVDMRVVLADNMSTDPATLASLEAATRRGHQVLRIPGWFCVPHLLNQAVERAADAEHLLFLEPGVETLDAGWLDTLLGRGTASAVGVVGALVAWPTGVIRDAGYVLGSRLAIAPRFTDRSISDDLSDLRLAAAHACSAVSAACLLTPRRLFVELDGFDVRAFPIDLYAHDYCQRAREAGRRVIFDPHVRLRFEGPTRVDEANSMFGPVKARETDIFRQRWTVATGCDPFYSPWMTMDGPPFSSLAWPPSPFEPRQPLRPRARPTQVGM